MRILVYGINYLPEISGVGKYTGEMAEWLLNQGHEVRVIAAPPYYPRWAISPPYSMWRYRTEMINGVKVYRAPLWVPKQPSGGKRLLHLASFAISSFLTLCAQWYWKPDVLWTVEPAFFCSPGALMFAKLRNCATWLHIQDYEVDAAFEMGLLKGPSLKKLVLRSERAILRGFDRVSSISEKMVERAQRKQVYPDKIVFFPNWVDTDAIQPLTIPSTYRAELSIPVDAKVCLYSGNMGLKQGLEILSEVASILRAEDNIFFVFCGNGAGKEALMAQCSALSNVRFMDLQPFARLNELLGLADVHLLPQRGDASDLVMPSKLTGIFASGKPVIVTAHPDTALAKIVIDCGIVCPPADALAVAEAIRILVRNPEICISMGNNARKCAVQELGKSAVLGKFHEELLACVGSQQST